MRNNIKGKANPIIQKYFENANKNKTTISSLSDDAKIRLVMEMRDRIFERCEKDLLNYTDIMKVLGFSKDQVYKLFRNSSFPAKRVNGCSTVTAIALAKWMLIEYLT